MGDLFEKTREAYARKRSLVIKKALNEALYTDRSKDIYLALKAQTSPNWPPGVPRPGLNWPALHALDARERTELINIVRGVFDLPPDKRMTTDLGPMPKDDKPDLKRPD
jgi:hypothetical protein